MRESLQTFDSLFLDSQLLICRQEWQDEAEQRLGEVVEEPAVQVGGVHSVGSSRSVMPE